MKGNFTVEVSAFSIFEFSIVVKCYVQHLKAFIPSIKAKIVIADDNAVIYHNKIKQGVANGSYFRRYNGLLPFKDYTVRISARNSMGYGKSSTAQKSVAAYGLHPDAPQSLIFDVFSELNCAHLLFHPPVNDEGIDITKYIVECDSSSSFTSNSKDYGSDTIEAYFEEQEIAVACESECKGTFSLSWGGKRSNFLDVEVSDIAIEIEKLLNVNRLNESRIKVTKQTYSFGNRWHVILYAFMVILLYGDNPIIKPMSC